MTSLPQIALLGDDRGHRSHQELNALIPRLATELDAVATWVPSDSDLDITHYDGVWLVPGSPYRNDAAVIEALTVVRTQGIPFIGSCGGMQYAVLEFVRSVLARPATHEEADGVREDNAVEALACSLYGEERLVTPVAGSRFARWVSEPFVGMHFCNYAPSAEVISELEAAGVLVGATAPDASAEVLEFPGHPFYVVSMFQPHIGAAQGEPIHGLIKAFVRASVDHARTSRPQRISSD